MLGHMTEVQRPQRTRNSALIGTSVILKPLPSKRGMEVMQSLGAKTAAIMRRRATEEVAVMSILLETLPAMVEEMRRPTSMRNQYVPATKPPMAAALSGAFVHAPLLEVSAR